MRLRIVAFAAPLAWTASADSGQNLAADLPSARSMPYLFSNG